MAMQMQTATPRGTEHALTGEEKIQHLRELFTDAPELGRKALDNVIQLLTEQATQPPPEALESAGRAGVRLGKVSELTILVPFAPGGAKRLRAFLRAIGGNLSGGASRVGTLHDMRFVFLENDTKMLFATAYDGDWDAYIDDFASKIPNALDMLLSNLEGFPGMHSPTIKDWLAAHQIAAESWYVAHPDLTVAETRRLKRSGQAVDEFLDKISD